MADAGHVLLSCTVCITQLSEAVALEEIDHHPSVTHEIHTFSLYQPELVLCDIIIQEWCRWSTHVHADVNRVDLIEESDVIGQLLLHLELKVIHLEIVDRVLKLIQVFFQIRVISCFLESIQKSEVVSVDEKADLDEVRNRFDWMWMHHIVELGHTLARMAAVEACILAASS